MAILEYLLLAGLLAGGIYTIGRLFIGWLRTARSASEDENLEGVADSQSHTPSSTGAPWHRRVCNDSERVLKPAGKR